MTGHRRPLEPADSYRPPALIDPATGRAQVIDPGTGVLVDAGRTPGTKRLGRGPGAA